jgi:alkylation response protein AidB-like acyl-CoA dehydrogenase
MQTAVGEIDARLRANARLIGSLADDLDAGGALAAQAAADVGPAKVVVTRAAIEAAQEAIALVGNPGLTMHHPLQRHVRDVLCSRIHSPQDDTILLGAGRAALGDAAGGGR